MLVLQGLCYVCLRFSLDIQKLLIRAIRIGLRSKEKYYITEFQEFSLFRKADSRELIFIM